MDRFDKIFDALDADVPDAPQSLAGPVDKMTTLVDAVTESQESNPTASLKKSLKYSTTVQPDTAAKSLDMSRKLNIPFDTAIRQGDRISKEMELSEIDAEELQRDYPIMAAQMSDPAKAAIMRPDVPNLKALEILYNDAESLKEQQELDDIPMLTKVGRDIKQSGHRGVTMDKMGEIHLKRMFFGDDALDNQQWLDWKREKERDYVDYRLPFLGRVPGAVVEAVGQIGVTIKEVAPVIAMGGVAGAAAAAGTAVAGGQIGPLAALPDEIVTVPAASIYGFKQGMKLAAGPAYLFQGWQVETGHAFNEYENITDDNGEKIERSLAIGGAAVTGIINMVPEAAASKFLTKFFPGAEYIGKEATSKYMRQVMKSDLGQSVLKNLGNAFEAAVVEGGTEGLQESVNVIIGEMTKLESDKEFENVFGSGSPEQQQEFINNWWGRVTESIERGAVGGAGVAVTGAATSYAVDNTAQVAADLLKASTEKYGKQQETITKRREAVRATETAKRSPAAFREYLKEQPQQDVYIDPAGVREFFQGNDPTIYENLKEFLPDLDEQILDASASGSDIVLSAADVDFMFSQTNAYDGLQPYMRLTPDAMRPDEVDVLSEFPEVTEDMMVEESRQFEIEDRIVQEIVATGRANESQARAYAQLIGEAYNNLSERAGGDQNIQAIIENALGDGLSVEGGKFGIDKRGLAQFIKDARRYTKNRMAAQAARDAKPQEVDLAGAKPKKPKKTPDRSPKPVIDYLSGKKIKTGSSAAARLKESGITPKTNPKMFSSTGTIDALESLSAEDMMESLSDLMFVRGNQTGATDDNPYYVDPEWLMDVIGDELMGKGARTEDQQAKEERLNQIDEFVNFLGKLDLDIETASDAEILAALDADQGKDQGGTTFNQEGIRKTDTPEFKAWFKDSKVVDENGEPLVVYHGTAGNIESFSKDRLGETTGAPSALEGFFFAGSQKTAGYYAESAENSQLGKKTMAEVSHKFAKGTEREAEKKSALDKFSGSNVVPVYLSIQNPIIHDMKGKMYRDKSFKSIIDKAKEQGHDGVIIKNAYDAGERGFIDKLFKKKDDIYVVFEPEQIKSQFNQGTFDPEDQRILYQGGESPRGSITYMNDGATVIRLFENSDRSTFLHEMGHNFLNIIRQASSTANFSGDYEIIRKWWQENAAPIHREAKRYNPYRLIPGDGFWRVSFAGQDMGQFNTKAEAREKASELHDGLKKELDDRGGVEYVRNFLNSDFSGADEVDQMILISMDEQFARGFESYLFDGKAPSMALEGVFRRFAVWLKKIYMAVNGLDVNVSDDLRGVFDRLLATDEAIAAAQKTEEVRVDPAVLEMMSTPMREAYMRQKEKQIEEAREKTFRKALRDADRETRKWWKEETAKAEDSLRDQYQNTPQYRAQESIKNGITDEGITVGKINDADLRAVYGDEVDLLPSWFVGKGGIDPDMAADAFGFPSVPEMVKTMKGLPDLEKRVKAEAKKFMIQKYGDTFLDGKISELAVSNLLGAEAEKLIEMEMKAASPRTGHLYPTNKDFKRAAEESLRNMRVTNAIKPARFFQGLRKATREAYKALGEKDYEGFAAGKRKELFSLHMFKKVRDFRRELEKANDRFAQILKKPQRSGKYTVDPEFHSMAWRVLANFKAGPAGVQGVSYSELKEWISAIDQVGENNETTNYSIALSDTAESAFQSRPSPSTRKMTNRGFNELTVDEFRAVRDLVYSIMEEGRRRREYIIDGEKHDFNTVRDQVVADIEKNVKERTSAWNKDSPLTTTADLYLAVQINAQTMFEQMDGGDLSGFVKKVFKRGIDIARGKENERITTMVNDLQKLFQDHYDKKELWEMAGIAGGRVGADVMEINGRKFTKMERLVAVMNLGNDGNREALEHGLGWSRQMTEGLVDTLDERDMDFVQAVWDYIDTYWHDIALLEAKRHGIPPEKVEATTLPTKWGDYRGGYFPIKFDPSKSSTAALFDLKREMSGYVGYASTQTRRSHTVERVGVNHKDKRPLLLDFGVITNHLHNVIHDLEMGDSIAQSAKMLRDPEVNNAIEDRFGVKGYQQLDLWLKDVAAGSQSSSDIFSQTAAWARTNATVSYMALSTTTILSQPSGFTNSIVALGGGVKGARWLGEGYRQQVQAIASGEYEAFLSVIHKKSSLMRDRSTTMNRDIREAHELWNANPAKPAVVRKALLSPIALTQKHTVDVAAWTAAYNQALTPENEGGLGKDEKGAVYYADEVVRNYQSSGLQEDVSGILRGTVSPGIRQSQLIKGFTLAFNYFNNKLNRIYAQTRRADLSTGKGIYDYTRDIIFLIWMDALVADLILNRLPGMTGEDDWDEVLKGWSWWILGQPIATLALGRDLFLKMRGYSAETPLGAVFGSIGNFIDQAKQGDLDKAMVKSTVTMLGMTTGVVPSVEINRMVDLMDRISEGKDIEYKDLIRGRRSEER